MVIVNVLPEHTILAKILNWRITSRHEGESDVPEPERGRGIKVLIKLSLNKLSLSQALIGNPRIEIPLPF